ncbi:MAG: hypothetical protein K2L77_09820, partial [Muribaculaceae bacterium]|nr:hypothetical protein [Muribaculaceae bacterium]
MRMNTLRGMALWSAMAMAAACIWADNAPRKPRRHTTPITTAATTTQAINETRDDTSRINAQRRLRSTHFHRDDGAIVYVDTITGEQWIDSTTIFNVPKMQYALLMGASVSVDIWDPVMRAFGQKYGLIGFRADVNLHNRYFPTFEIGLGQAKNTSDAGEYTYSSPMSVYFKIGADYNFLYNSNPDYKWFAGIRYGFAPFSWNISDIEPAPGYWGPTSPFAIPSQNATAGWVEFGVGLRIKLWRNISAGWTVKLHSLIHESKNVHGKPWYIPGYGSRNGMVTGSFAFTYTVPINARKLEFAPDTVPGTGI